MECPDCKHREFAEIQIPPPWPPAEDKMKYKNIHAAIHNFGHSFLSLMNYVDDVYVRDQLWDLRSQGYDIEINWLTGTFSPADRATPVITKSIDQYAATLKKHLMSHHLEPACLREIKLLIPARGRITMQALDDRNKMYRIHVNELK